MFGEPELCCPSGHECLAFNLENRDVSSVPISDRAASPRRALPREVAGARCAFCELRLEEWPKRQSSLADQGNVPFSLLSVTFEADFANGSQKVDIPFSSLWMASLGGASSDDSKDPPRQPTVGAVLRRIVSIIGVDPVGRI
jgi:hypothetical protein